MEEARLRVLIEDVRTRRKSTGNRRSPLRHRPKPIDKVNAEFRECGAKARYRARRVERGRRGLGVEDAPCDELVLHRLPQLGV